MSGPVDLLACYWTLAGNYVFGDADHSPWDFRLRAEAAAAAGYTGIGIKQADLRRVLAQHGISGMRAILKDNGIRHLELEALFDWCAEGERRKASDADRQLLLATAAELGAARIKAAGDFGAAEWPLEQMHDAFQVLAREAQEAGSCVTLEPIAFSNIPDLDTALTIIGGSAGRGSVILRVAPDVADDAVGGIAELLGGLESHRVHHAPAAQDHVVGLDSADVEPLRLLLVARVGHFQQGQCEAVFRSQFLQDFIGLLTIGRTVVKRDDLLALELIQATDPLADVIDDG